MRWPWQRKSAAPVDSRGGWWPVIREPFAGAWQQNVELRPGEVLTYSAVFACMTRIAADIGKLRVKLVEQDANGIWTETTSSAFSPVLRKPNRYQTRIKFFEQWMVSKLANGNAYALKERDARGVVAALYMLDPTRVTPLVTPDGGVYYQLSNDDLAGVKDSITVPASEIIHDTMVCLHHPLVGVSPIYASGMASTQGLKIQSSSARFFANNSQPGGVLTAPGKITSDTAGRLRAEWERNYGGENAGRVAVLGDGLKYEQMAVNAVDAQLMEQLKWTAETVCACFHVPPYMIGVGPVPSYNNVEALNQQYYTQCLQSLIESAELCLDEGLELPAKYGTEFDLDGLLRMDTATRYKSHSDAISGGWMSPNEARRREDMPPVEGGDSPLIQQQNYSLAALAKRDARDDPFSTAQTAAPALPAAEDEADEEELSQRAADEMPMVVRSIKPIIVPPRAPLQ